MATKRDLEARIAELEKENKTLKSSKNASKTNNNGKYNPLTKAMAKGMSEIVVKESKAGNTNVTSYTTKEFTAWLKSNGYAFPSGKYFNKGILKQHWAKAQKDLEKNGIAVLKMTPYGQTTGI